MLTSRIKNQRTASAKELPSLKRQLGLGSVELVLITMVLMVLMHVTLRTAESLVHYHARVVEARNAAYKVELYLAGEPSIIDNAINTIDTEAIQPLEDMLEQASPLLDYLEIDTAVTGLSQYMGSAVAGYAKHEPDNDQLYDEMIALSWDNMNDFPVDGGDDDLMIPKSKRSFWTVQEPSIIKSDFIGA